MERMVARVLESKLLDVGVRQLLASEELWEMIDEIARSPAVGDAIAHQSMGLADEMADEVRIRSRRVDDWLERATRRAMRRGDRPRPGPDLPGNTSPA
jgi:hypothetical protein